MAGSRPSLFYVEGYEYQVVRELRIFVPELVGFEFDVGFARLTRDGWLVIKEGYAFDGSTYALDTWWSQLAAAVHDAVCQAWNEGLVHPDARHAADLAYERLCLEAIDDWRKSTGSKVGAAILRQWARARLAAISVYGGVRKPSGKRKILEAV